MLFSLWKSEFRIIILVIPTTFIETSQGFQRINMGVYVSWERAKRKTNSGCWNRSYYTARENKYSSLTNIGAYGQTSEHNYGNLPFLNFDNFINLVSFKTNHNNELIIVTEPKVVHFAQCIRLCMYMTQPVTSVLQLAD